MHLPTTKFSVFPVRIVTLLYFCLSVAVSSASEKFLGDGAGKTKGYAKGDSVPVSCLNRTIESGEHIRDSLGNFQYVPFPVCNETGLPLAFAYDTATKVVCTIAYLEDDLYHLLEYFVHSDVPLTCRVPSYPLQDGVSDVRSSESAAKAEGQSDSIGSGVSAAWTPLTIALQGALQLSHLHLHTGVNVLFHTSVGEGNPPSSQHLIAATAYSLPNLTAPSAANQGTKVLRTEPLVFTFNAGWIDGDALPGMIGRPTIGVKDHDLGFTLLSFSALAASAGLGAMAMMIWERKKSRRSLSFNGLSPGGVRELGMNGHSGYGGYGRYGSGKRD